LFVSRRLHPSKTVVTMRILHQVARFKRPLLPHRRSFSVKTTDCARIEATKRWYERVVLAGKLCPFAPRPQSATLRIVSTDASSPHEAFEDVASEIDFLFRNESSHETTLIALMDDIAFTGDFRDFVRFSWELQEHAVSSKYPELLQLVLFHPKATHQTYGEGPDSPEDYTIRSPYPIVHLLREEDVMKAVKGGYRDLEGLPARNKAKMRDLGIEACEKVLQECYEAI